MAPKINPLYTNIFQKLLFTSKKALHALYLYAGGIISIIVMYFLLAIMEQGIDVVIQGGERVVTGLLGFLGIIFSGYLIWYSSRLVSYIRQQRDTNMFQNSPNSDELYKHYAISTEVHRHIPRMLAYNCFLVIQIAIFRLPTFFSWSANEVLGVALLANLFYFFLRPWVEGKFSGRNPVGIVISLALSAYAAFLFYLIFEGWKTDIFSGHLRHTFWLAITALVAFLLQLGSMMYFAYRRKSIDNSRAAFNGKQSVFLNFFNSNIAYNSAEKKTFDVFNFFSFCALVLYFLAIFNMEFSDTIGPMAFVLLALGILTGLSNMLTALSIRYNFNLFLIPFLGIIVIGMFRDPYFVRLLDTTGKKEIFAKRPDTKTYLKRWFKHRLPLIQQHDKFPVYIILSNGGASRAGHWTSSVLSHLQDSSYLIAPENSFKDHVLGIAGASGGSVGNTAFYSLLKAEHEGKMKPDEFTSHCNTFFKADFLTYTVARLLGPDLFWHFIPFRVMGDRAAALEDVIANGSEDQLLREYFNKPVSEVFDTTGALPILYINTTQVDNGMPGVISSVKLDTLSQRQDVLVLLDSMSKRNLGDLRLSTAAVLSSRFPYVSPAGKVFDRYYVDGGYFDNSGAGIVLELIEEIKRFIADSSNQEITKYRDRLSFHLIHVTNSESLKRPSGDIHPVMNDLLAPVLTLAGMQGSSTNIGNGVLRNNFRELNSEANNAFIQYSLYDEDWDLDKNNSQYEEGYPMSWFLSDYQLFRMKKALRLSNKKNFKKFTFTRPMPLADSL